jgi:hypothetical protein
MELLRKRYLHYWKYESEIIIKIQYYIVFQLMMAIFQNSLMTCNLQITFLQY